MIRNGFYLNENTAEITDSKDSSYTVYNLHINGVYHCSLRYRQLYDFQLQLKKEFDSIFFPPFPPKKFLSLSSSQIEERRIDLEKYIQLVSQLPQIANSSTFNGFLLAAQQESQHQVAEEVSLDVYLSNGHKITVGIKSTDQTEAVLEAVASKVELSDQYVYYFGLFLVSSDSANDCSIVRKLQDFESPYISLKSVNTSGTYRILLRKAYWDSVFDEDLIEDRIAMNILYVQAVSDFDCGWTCATKEQSERLLALQQRGSKKEYLKFIRTLKFYGFIVFNPCITDYPYPNTSVLISAGNKELNFRLQIQDEEKNIDFKVTRMRCWRISSATIPDGDAEETSSHGARRLELSFEYLVAKNTLKWVTLYSSQAILMSMCLQGMVDELIMKKEGRKIKKPQDRNKIPKSNVITRQISSQTPKSPKSPNTPNEEKTPSLPKSASTSKHPFCSGLSGNDAFDGIHDDDL